MSSVSCIGQKGIIQNITNGHAKVNITSFSACSACASKAACQLGETSEKIIDVPVDNSDYHVGEIVTVIIEKSLGLRAAFLAYILPFIIVLFILILLSSFGVSEVISGISSLLVLVPYYFIIYLKRNYLQKKFTISLSKEV